MLSRRIESRIPACTWLVQRGLQGSSSGLSEVRAEYAEADEPARSSSPLARSSWVGVPSKEALHVQARLAVAIS